MSEYAAVHGPRATGPSRDSGLVVRASPTPRAGRPSPRRVRETPRRAASEGSPSGDVRRRHQQCAVIGPALGIRRSPIGIGMADRVHRRPGTRPPGRGRRRGRHRYVDRVGGGDDRTAGGGPHMCTAVAAHQGGSLFRRDDDHRAGVGPVWGVGSTRPGAAPCVQRLHRAGPVNMASWRAVRLGTGPCERCAEAGAPASRSRGHGRAYAGADTGLRVPRSMTSKSPCTATG